jgi:hypothetical protein
MLTSLFQSDLGYLCRGGIGNPKEFAPTCALTARLGGAAAIEKVLSTLANSW